MSTPRGGRLGTPLRLSNDSTPEMIRNYHGSPVAKAISLSVAQTLVEYANERDALRAALLNLRETVDLYVTDDVGMPELADAMDKAYAVLYPARSMA